jgi:hypothetical protein
MYNSTKLADYWVNRRNSQKWVALQYTFLQQARIFATYELAKTTRPDLPSPLKGLALKENGRLFPQNVSVGEVPRVPRIFMGTNLPSGVHYLVRTFLAMSLALCDYKC